MPVIKPGWTPVHAAVHRERLRDDDGAPALALLRHPSHPLRAEVDASAPESDLRAVAMHYLQACDGLDPALDRARQLLAADQKQGFGWLAIGWDAEGEMNDPMSSFYVRRKGSPQGSGSAVLLAANRLPVGTTVRPEGLAVGLRVTLHLGPKRLGRREVRVTSLACSRLARAIDAAQEPREQLVNALNDAPRLALLRQLVAQTFAFAPLSVGFSGFLSDDDLHFRVAGVAMRPEGRRPPRSYQWAGEFQLPALNTSNAGGPLLIGWRLVEQLSPVTGPPAGPKAKLFLRDPASAGPADTRRRRLASRDDAALDAWRAAAALPAQLQDTQGRFEVMQSVVADGGSDPEKPQTVDPLQLPLRSDHLAAAHAYRRAEELFERIDDCGLGAASVFKFARLPLRLRHRASFNHRPDGQSINAQVRPDAAPPAYLAPPAPAERPRLEVLFGAASVRHRRRGTNDKGRQTAQPIGLAADPRWAWHEFGHVLAFAATGALELQFAHGVGDALAAVLCDPDSKLQAPASWLLRGETFPWVATGRRHDREAALGWCWCGARNGMRRAPLVIPPLLVKGYVEEQMLSSTLFRLYRTIGGDTSQSLPRRRRAAATCAELVIRALLLCGPAGLVPVRSADLFLTALVDADIGRPGGGTLHKVCRWAFECQGLFATALQEEDRNGRGLPPAVDLWIADRRPGADGGYEPVPLGPSDDEPWHAAPQALAVVNGSIEVRVGNRGQQASAAGAMRLWLARATGGLLDWADAGQAVIPVIPDGKDVVVTLPLPPAAAGGPWWLLAEATTAGDRSNRDPASGLPCAGPKPPAAPARLLELVANDNNLGLRWLPNLT